MKKKGKETKEKIRTNSKGSSFSSHCATAVVLAKFCSPGPSSSSSLYPKSAEGEVRNLSALFFPCDVLCVRGIMQHTRAMGHSFLDFKLCSGPGFKDCGAAILH
jgi:hypothetical protein